MKAGSLTVVVGYLGSRDIDVKLVIGPLKQNLSPIVGRSSREEAHIFDVPKSKPEAWWDTIHRRIPLDSESSGRKM